ncbi:TonB-dependent receptor [Litorimonas haliclonae]|uniref:TonB-dependent receptor n=1 Tax=Litorimonas haliclonae TaxID=2081977 RepID=UPI0039EE83F1
MRLKKTLMASGALSILVGLGVAQTSYAQAPDEDVITVYGTKIEQSLMEVPASVDITTAEEIAREPISDLYDIVERIPNVNAALGEQGYAIRGIDQRGVGGGGNGNTITVYVDDAPLGNQTTFFGPTGSWDVGQVEVYRGPQSTNFGRNALAGAIYIRTQDPSYEPDLKVRAEFAERGTHQISAAGGTALIEDRVAFRLSADYRESDGFIANTFLEDDADATELLNLRGKLLIEPTENLSIISTTTYAENNAGEDVVDPTNGFTNETAYDLAGREGTETFLQSVNANYDISPKWSLQSITSYQTTDYIRVEDFDVTPLPLASVDRTGDDKALSQEIRLKYQGVRLKAAIGAYYVDTERGFDTTTTVPISILDPRLPSSLFATQGSFYESQVENFALFADGEFALSDKFDLLFGARYDMEDNQIQAVTDTEIISELPPSLEYLRAFEGSQEQLTEDDFNAFLPKIGLRWRAHDTTNFTFLAQKGYRAGGSEISIVDGSTSFYDPEYLWNYEVSSRSTFFDGKMRVNANVFYSDWTNQQVPVPISPATPLFTYTVNAGESELYGLELDGSLDLDDGLELYGSLGYVHTEFKDFPISYSDTDEVNLAGNSFPFAPEFSLNAGFNKQHDFGLFYGADLNLKTSQFSDNENQVASKLDDVALVNARLGYEIDERFKISIYARNLFDKEYYTFLNQQTGTGVARIGDPQVFGIRFDADLF